MDINQHYKKTFTHTLITEMSLTSRFKALTVTSAGVTSTLLTVWGTWSRAIFSIVTNIASYLKKREGHLNKIHFQNKFTETGVDQLITIYFKFTQLIVCKLGIVGGISGSNFTLVVVNDVTSVNRTVDSLVLWWCTVHCLYLMETKMAVFFGGCVWHVKEKSGHSRNVRWRTWIN